MDCKKTQFQNIQVYSILDITAWTFITQKQICVQEKVLR